jgi:hypothetical protein
MALVFTPTVTIPIGKPGFIISITLDVTEAISSDFVITAVYDNQFVMSKTFAPTGIGTYTGALTLGIQSTAAYDPNKLQVAMSYYVPL